MATIVVCERIEPGHEPDYCIHGRPPCRGDCGEWVWLGAESLQRVQDGADPLCLQCAHKYVKPEHAVYLTTVREHR